MTTSNARERKVPGTKFYRGQDPISIRNLYGEIKLFCGSASRELGHQICEYLGIEAGDYERFQFSNENIFTQLRESVRGQDVFVVQSMATPNLHDNIMELLILLDTIKRDSAARITAVIPYLAYSRSDKKDQPRVPITARLLAEMIQIAGADRYITIDLHSGQIQGFFRVPGDVLTAFYLLSDHLADLRIENAVICTTDLGFAKRARGYASRLGLPLAFVEKRRRTNLERPELMALIGEVKGKNVILVDDEVNTAGSVENAVGVVQEHGAKDVYLAFTHPILSTGGVDRLRKLPFKAIITTNTVPIPAEKLLPNMAVLSVAPLLAEVIIRSHEGRSVGALFDE
ncbi:MAG: ribose-phosphate diphosphokinase [Anaerolineae bacterium]|nr:ribose-phosphate diphosphokinase [Anaerolineae bacterium]